ncbi:MAG: glycosyltransferase [Gammaproteobacteria bacterium]|nr:glycosyltransferase [Gammaproteobacteria bacterium]
MLNADRRNIVCMKWGTKFPASDVNRLRAMVRRHLATPHRFVCFTDNPEGLDTDIDARPLPDVGWEDQPDINAHGWRKVGLFGETLADLEGQALYLDLDVVIVDALDPFLEGDTAFKVIKDYRPVRWRGDSFVGNTSVMRFEIGAHPVLLERFRREFPAIRDALRNEQEYLSHYFHERGLLEHWPAAWCPSFKRHCVGVGPLTWLRTPSIPSGARVIVFHGSPKPEEALEGRGGKWYRHIRPTPWIRDHWG